MQQLVNQYSFLWVSGALVLLVAFLLFRKKPKATDFFALAVVLAGLVVAWFLLRPTQTPLMEDARKVHSMIGQGKPVLLEFQSPY